MVRAQAADPDASLSALVARAAHDVAGRDLALSDDELARVLSPEYFVEVRRTHGGPARAVVEEALSVARANLTADEAALSGRRGSLSAASARLKEAVTAI